MAGVSKSEIPDEAQFFTEFWKLVKDFYQVEENDDYWNYLCDRINEIDEQCNHCRLGQVLMNGFADYLEEKRQGKKMYQIKQEGLLNENHRATG
ncbi:MAG: hypothetical protein LUD12_02820 [Lachnospiraceae bacterium]|nr:hypothetical protein [Lachnospiraceae bacterium]